MPLNPGTIIEGSSDPRTVEQNAALRSMQVPSTGEIGSQYAGSIILPDGTVTRDTSVLNVPSARTAEVNSVLSAAGKLNADGVTRSGGYVIITDTNGVPVQYVGCSNSTVQTNADKATASINGSQLAQGLSHRNAIELAAQGVQTDGTPVTSSYLDLIERWAKAEGIPFVRPSAAVINAMAMPAPASVVVTTGQGIAAAPVQNGLPVVPVTSKTDIPAMTTPTFTSGTIIAERFIPDALAAPAAVPVAKPNVLPLSTTSPVLMAEPSPDAATEGNANLAKNAAVVGVVLLLVLAAMAGSSK